VQINMLYSLKSDTRVVLWNTDAKFSKELCRSVLMKAKIASQQSSVIPEEVLFSYVVSQVKLSL
jgi:hypothetical protein